MCMLNVKRNFVCPPLFSKFNSMAPFSGLILSLLLESALGMKMRCSLPRLPANYSSERLTVDTAQKTVWLIFSNVQVYSRKKA